MYTGQVRIPIAAAGCKIQLTMEVKRKDVHYQITISVESNSHGSVDNVLLLLSCRENLIPFHCVRCWFFFAIRA